VVLYEMLCGRTPFVSDPSSPMAIVHQHVFTDPRPPQALRRDIPSSVEALLLRMLAKAPEHRPDMAQVASMIESLAGSAVELSSRFLRLRSGGIYVAVLIAMLLLLLVPLLFELVYFLRHDEPWLPKREPPGCGPGRKSCARGATVLWRRLPEYGVRAFEIRDPRLPREGRTRLGPFVRNPNSRGRSFGLCPGDGTNEANPGAYQ
jgi:hypothetical protein